MLDCKICQTKPVLWTNRGRAYVECPDCLCRGPISLYREDMEYMEEFAVKFWDALHGCDQDHIDNG